MFLEFLSFQLNSRVVSAPSRNFPTPKVNSNEGIFPGALRGIPVIPRPSESKREGSLPLPGGPLEEGFTRKYTSVPSQLDNFQLEQFNILQSRPITTKVNTNNVNVYNNDFTGRTSIQAQNQIKRINSQENTSDFFPNSFGNETWQLRNFDEPFLEEMVVGRNDADVEPSPPQHDQFLASLGGGEDEGDDEEVILTDGQGNYFMKTGNGQPMYPR